MQDGEERSAAEEGSSAKKLKTEEVAGMVAEAAEKTMRKKKVMKRVSPEHVEFVLSSKPTPPRMLHQESHERMSDELRHAYALYHEIISNKNELLRSLRHKYRNDLATKGFVEVEIEVDES